MTDDFTPMVEQGELEPISGLLGRVRRRHDLAPVGAGFVRVLIAEDGTPIPGGQQLTGGEKRWSKARGWIRVDVGHHTLEYRIPFSDLSGRAGFVAAVTVDVAVRDAAEAARQGATGVKGFVEPALRRVVAEAGGAADPVHETDPIATLMTMGQHADAKVRELVQGAVRGLPPWLSADVLSVTVAFDDATQRHHAELVERTRRGELIDANAENDKKEAAAALAVRALWRDQLLPHLSDPSQRVFEVAFANPTDENISRAVGQANNTELALLAQGFEVLQSMVEKDFVDKDDPIYATIKAISGKLEHLYVSGAATALPSPAAQPKLESPSATDDQPPEEQKGDRDFGDS